MSAWAYDIQREAIVPMAERLREGEMQRLREDNERLRQERDKALERAWRGGGG